MITTTLSQPKVSDNKNLYFGSYGYSRTRSLLPGWQRSPLSPPLQPLDHCMLPSISVTTTGAAQAEIYWSSAAQNNIIMKSQYRIFCKPHSYTDTVNINCTNSANIITYNKAYDGIHLPYQLSESKKGLIGNLLLKSLGKGSKTHAR